ncbi:MAG: hypothetical protein UU16_C0028G0011, partial [Candidatus Woesebacteria bacterium GW2011_GWA2_40_7]
MDTLGCLHCLLSRGNPRSWSLFSMYKNNYSNSTANDSKDYSGKNK